MSNSMICFLLKVNWSLEYKLRRTNIVYYSFEMNIFDSQFKKVKTS